MPGSETTVSTALPLILSRLSTSGPGEYQEGGEAAAAAGYRRGTGEGPVKDRRNTSHARIINRDSRADDKASALNLPCLGHGLRMTRGLEGKSGLIIEGNEPVPSPRPRPTPRMPSPGHRVSNIQARGADGM